MECQDDVDEAYDPSTLKTLCDVARCVLAIDDRAQGTVQPLHGAPDVVRVFGALERGGGDVIGAWLHGEAAMLRTKLALVLAAPDAWAVGGGAHGYRVPTSTLRVLTVADGVRDLCGKIRGPSAGVCEALVTAMLEMIGEYTDGVWVQVGSITCAFCA
eukprot:m.691400 g.691400  ORF g.691400 m.691400 type:complete len:158 (-) comp22855_c0_seq5:129-602(-)